LGLSFGTLRIVPLLACVALSCRSTPADPPPAHEKFEVPVAPPGALGAYAAGTDAAPQTPTEEAPPWGSEQEPAEEEPLPDMDAGMGTPEAGGIAL
jgi:hypothetical protein